MTHFNRPPTIDDLVEQKTERIEQGVRDKMPKAKFRVCTVSTDQRNRTRILMSQQNALHPNWESLDSERRSAACRLEWARMIIFMAVYVLPALLKLNVQGFHVIVADRRWQVSANQLSPCAFDRPRRKLRNGMQRLRRMGVTPVYVAAYELSAARNLDGTYPFEPHIHLLVFGATKPELEEAFSVRQHKSERGKLKPIRVKLANGFEFGNILGYLSKIKPEERVQYIGDRGRFNRKTNRMSEENLSLWLSCLSGIPITQMIQFGGFAEPMTYRFATSEMANLIGELG